VVRHRCDSMASLAYFRRENMPFPPIINRGLDYRGQVDALFNDIGQLR